MGGFVRLPALKRIASAGQVSMHVPQALTFDITPMTTEGNGMVESYRQGLFRQPVTWDLVEMSRAAVLVGQAEVQG